MSKLCGVGSWQDAGTSFQLRKTFNAISADVLNFFQGKGKGDAKGYLAFQKLSNLYGQFGKLAEENITETSLESWKISMAMITRCALLFHVSNRCCDGNK